MEGQGCWGADLRAGSTVRVPSRTAPEPEEADRVGRWSQRYLGSLLAMLRSPGEAETQLWEEGKRCWSVQRSGVGDVARWPVP